VSGHGVHPSILTIRCRHHGVCSILNSRPVMQIGYRVYFGKEGEQIVILLGGGTKQRRQNDIKVALERWEDYKQRKKQQKEKEKEKEKEEE